MKSSTVFSKCARKTGFAGTSTTRYRLLDAALLVVNHQRASESRGFYVNAGLYFPELLAYPLAPDDLETAFRYRSSIPTPHVDWRAGFAATHGNRESVRRLNQDGNFRALIRREV
ncbi:MAG: hypothetical protein DI592_23555 [Stenotrophomonas maltophilia]|nr:MAG: hypothetical protein DI592_23555 [Stenotrophomonas maltophilia]